MHTTQSSQNAQLGTVNEWSDAYKLLYIHCLSVCLYVVVLTTCFCIENHTISEIWAICHYTSDGCCVLCLQRQSRKNHCQSFCSFTTPSNIQHLLTPFSLQGDCVVNKRDNPEDGNVPRQLPSVWTRVSDTRTGLPIHKGAVIVRRRVLKEEWVSFKAACKKTINTHMDLHVIKHKHVCIYGSDV